MSKSSMPRRNLVFILFFVIIAAAAQFSFAADAPSTSPDPAGFAAPTGNTGVAINMVWMLIAGFLVMFMQAGFALVETGLCRAKNAGHTMSMNFLVYALGMTGFFICGYALMCGGVGAAPATVNAAGNAVLNAPFAISIAGHGFTLFGMKGFF